MTKKYNQEGEVLKAGGIIIRDRNSQKEVLMVTSKNRDYSFPKGHFEGEESLEEGALRECTEETGLKLEIIRKLPDLRYRWLEKGEDIVVHYFLMKVMGGKLKKEYPDNHLKWVPD